jgi:hypothetical protein
VTFVTRSDTRLVADLEKLLKAKLEIEPIEFDEDGPDIRRQGRINDGRRMYAVDDVPAEPRAGTRARPDSERRERGPRRDLVRDLVRPPPVSRDPFFDKPYEEPAALAEAPPWEASGPRPARSISANIKPKRRVAALFKPELPATSEQS